MIKLRNENYFEKKLEMSKDKLSMAQRKLEHFDIQMEALKVRFEHDKKVYNDQAKHMQEIVADMEKRIPKLEKKLRQGYTHVDLNTGKAYKSFDDIHIAQLEAKRLETIERQRAIAEKQKKRQELRDTKDRSKLSKAEKELVIAIEIQDDMQSEDEIKANQEKELERIQKKREFYEEELFKLGNPVENIIEEALEDIEEAVETIEEVIKPEPVLLPKKALIKTPDTELDKMKEVSRQANEFKTELNGVIKEMEWLLTLHQDWMLEYTEEEGGKAIHAGRIVNGFRSWCENKGYKIELTQSSEFKTCCILFGKK